MRRITTVLCLVCSLLLSSCAEPGAGDAKKDIPLRIGYSRLRISLPIFAAQEKGIFSRNGLRTELQSYDTAQPMAQALAEGKIEIAGYTALPITYTAMIRSKRPLYFTTLMVEDQDHRISYLLRRKLPKPAIRTVRDLKGKKVGILPTIAYKAWLGVILKENGLDPDVDVIIQQIDPAQEVSALKSGGVDALFTNDPPATAAIISGAGELFTDIVECPRYIENPFPFGSFNMTKEWGDTHPAEMTKLIASLDEAIAYVNANPAEAKLLLKKYLPEQFQTQVERYADARYLPSTEAHTQIFTGVAEKYLSLGIIPERLNMAGLVRTARH